MGIAEFINSVKVVAQKFISGDVTEEDLEALTDPLEGTAQDFLTSDYGRDLIKDLINKGTKSSEELDLDDLKEQVLEVMYTIMPNIDLTVFRDMVNEVHASEELTPTYDTKTQLERIVKRPEGVVTKPPEPEFDRGIEIAPTTETVSEPVITPSVGTTNFFEASSPNIMNEEELLKEIKRIRVGHIITSISIGVLAVLIEIASLGQIDALHEMTSIIYNLSSWSTIYDQTKGMENEARLLRVYRYYVEKENLTNIPSPNDLITMLTREQLGDTPEESLEVFTRFMSYFGFDPFWSNAYWGSHWQLPNTGELYEMFGRGIIDNDTLRKQLEINDNKPEWIDRLIELSYRIPSRTEARLISRVRRMSDDKLERILKAERINPDFLDDYRFFLQNQELDTIQLQELSKYKDLFISGFITEDEYKIRLAESVLSPLEQEVSLKRDIADQLKDILNRDVDSIIDIFKIRAKASIKAGTPEAINRVFLDNDLKVMLPNPQVRDSIIDNVFANLGLEFDLEDLET